MTSTASSPVRRTMAASMPGSGRPIDPGRMSIAAKFAIMMPPVSVCHQLSWNGRPNASTPQTTASGLSGSPTLARKRSEGNACCRAAAAPTFISMRIAVGAVYQTRDAFSAAGCVPALGVEVRLVDDAREAVRERRDDAVRGAGHPARIGRAPEDVVRMEVEREARGRVMSDDGLDGRGWRPWVCRSCRS